MRIEARWTMACPRLSARSGIVALLVTTPVLVGDPSAGTDIPLSLGQTLSIPRDLPSPNFGLGKQRIGDFANGLNRAAPHFAAPAAQPVWSTVAKARPFSTHMSSIHLSGEVKVAEMPLQPALDISAATILVPSEPLNLTTSLAEVADFSQPGPLNDLASSVMVSAPAEPRLANDENALPKGVTPLPPGSSKFAALLVEPAGPAPVASLTLTAPTLEQKGQADLGVSPIATREMVASAYSQLAKDEGLTTLSSSAGKMQTTALDAAINEMDAAPDPSNDFDNFVDQRQQIEAGGLDADALQTATAGANADVVALKKEVVTGIRPLAGSGKRGRLADPESQDTSLQSGIGQIQRTSLGLTFEVNARIDGASVGRVSLLIKDHSNISVRLGDLLSVLKARIDPALYERLSASDAANTYITFNELREEGIAVGFDQYDRLNLGG